MNKVYEFFGGKKFFFALFLFLVASAMRVWGALTESDMMSEDTWLIVALSAAGGYGLLNVATEVVHAFAKVPINGEKK